MLQKGKKCPTLIPRHFPTMTYKADPSRDTKLSTTTAPSPEAQRETKNQTTDFADAHRTLFLKFPMAACWLLAAVHAPLPTVLLCQASDAPRFPLIFVLVFGQFLRRSASFGLLSALGNGHVTGASSAVVAPLQRLIATDLATVVVAPVTPGSFHRISSSREEDIFLFNLLPFLSWCSCVRIPHDAIYWFLGKCHAS